MKRAAVIIGLLASALVATGCGAGRLGGSSGRYRVVAIFDNASFLIPGQDVRIAGANVGSVKAVTLTPDNHARIEMEIDPKFAPFRSDADCFIAPQSLIGERFIQCAPGTSRGRPLKGDPPAVPLGRTHSPVDPDLVTATFRLPVRERITILLNELGAGLAGNGQALSAAIRRANPAIQATQDVLTKVDRDREVLGRLVDRSDQVIAQLARRRDRVASFIQEASDVSRTAARRDGAISEGIARLPGTLDETKASLSTLRTLAQRAQPLLGDLHQAAPSLTRLVDDTPALATAARPALRHLAGMSRTGTTTLRDSHDVVRRLRTFASLSVPAGQLVAQLNESLRDRGVVEGIQRFVYLTALTLSRFDKDSHIQPAYLVGAADCAVYATTTDPACDAHLVKGSATARAHTRAKRAHRRRAHRRHRAQRPHQDSAPQAPSSSGGTSTPPVHVPKLPDLPNLPRLPQTPPLPPLPGVPAPPSTPSPSAPRSPDPGDLLDYLLGP
jgi:virulence factor Mce-like protein